MEPFLFIFNPSFFGQKEILSLLCLASYYATLYDAAAVVVVA